MQRCLLLCGTLLLCTFNQIQATEILERFINVRFQQTPLKEALATVAQKGGFELSYNANILNGSKKISLVTNNWTVRETLYELLGENYLFKANGNYLILKARKKPAEEIFGYIKNPKTGDPVAHATVYDRNTLRATTTDENGYYELKVKKVAEIAITRLDYQDTLFSITATSPRIQKIELKIDTATAPQKFSLEKMLRESGTTVERFFKVSLAHWSDLNVRDSLHRRFQISLLPKIGTNHTLSSKVINDWSINVLAGTSRGNRLLELAGLGNFTREDMTGVQAAGLFNELRGDANGIQIGGLYNRAADTLRGIQVAGLFSTAHAGQGSSVQVSGAFNHIATGQELVQIAGVINLGDQIQGVQIAGLINKAEEVNGVQVAGLFNRAKKVHGLQIGLFNSTKSLHGLQIGLINRSGKRVLPIINW